MSKLLKLFHVTAWSVLLFIAKPLLAGISLLQVLPVHHINWFDLSIVLLGGVGLLLGLNMKFKVLAGVVQIIILVLKTTRNLRPQPQPVARVVEFETLKHGSDTGAHG